MPSLTSKAAEILLSRDTPDEKPAKPVEGARRNSPADLLSRARDKLPSQSGKASSGTSPTGTGSSQESPNGRVIPPEPVQLQTEGDFSLTESERPLQLHNLSRAAKECQKLEWDGSLAQDAESYAWRMARSGILEKSGVEAQGENIYTGPGDAKFEDAVDSWLDEEKKYNGERIGEGDIQDWGQFTQCLWRNTTHVGMGKAKSSDGKATYIVARYAPCGNVQGEKPF